MEGSTGKKGDVMPDRMDVNETSSMELLHWIGSTHPTVMVGLVREKVCHCGICMVCAYYRVQGELRVMQESRGSLRQFIGRPLMRRVMNPDGEEKWEEVGGPGDAFYGGGGDSREPSDTVHRGD